jgi:hypothetical protein
VGVGLPSFAATRVTGGVSTDEELEGFFFLQVFLTGDGEGWGESVDKDGGLAGKEEELEEGGDDGEP